MLCAQLTSVVWKQPKLGLLYGKVVKAIKLSLT